MRLVSRRGPAVRQTALDRVIGYVAPALARDRLVARLQLNALGGWGGGYGSGFHGGKKGRRQTQNWLPLGGDADADLLPDLPTLRQRARDAGRNVAVAGGAIERDVLNTIGGGLWPQPEIDRETLGLDEETAAAWERMAQRIFWAWSDRRECDATGVQQFGAYQATALRATLESGDAFTLRRYIDTPGRVLGLALQLYEADQVSNPHGRPDGAELGAGEPGAGNRLTGGIETGAHGVRVAAYVQKTHPGVAGGRVRNEWARVPFEQAGQWAVLQHFERLRPNQARGAPMLAPVLELLKQLGDYTEAELIAAVLSAMIAIVHKSPDGGELPASDPTEAAAAPLAGDELTLKNGTILDLDDVSDVKSPTPGRPNGGFEPFFVALVRQIGARLGIPFEVLIMHFTASYSASRAALEMAWQHFRRRREWLIESLCEPAWEAVVTEAVASGRLAAPGFFEDPLIRQAWLGCRWTGPKRISVDPLKEANADAVEEDRGWKSAAQNAAERGNDFDATHVARKREVALRVADGLQASPGGGAAAAPADRAGDTPSPARRRDDDGDDDGADEADEADGARGGDDDEGDEP